MFTKLQKLSDSQIAIYSLNGSKPTATFKRGTCIVDPTCNTLVMGKSEPLSLPEDFSVAEGMDVTLVLYNSLTGDVRSLEPRTVTLQAEKRKREKTGRLVAAGVPKTESKFKLEDGWPMKTLRFRVYEQHTGVPTDYPRPDWVTEFIGNSREAWNRSAWMCQHRRRACYAPFQESLKTFRDDRLFPAIREFNLALGKDKLKFPKRINKEYLDLGPFMTYSGYLKRTKQEGHPVPEDIANELEALIADIKEKIDYGPINDYRSRFADVYTEATEGLDLFREQRDLIRKKLEIVLQNRNAKGKGVRFDQNWPRIKYADEAIDWSMQTHINSAGQPIQDLLSQSGVGGLRLGPPIPHTESGHPNMDPQGHNVRDRALRSATIRLSKEIRQSDGSSKRVPLTYSFCVLQSQPFPDQCHIKQWTLVEKGGKMWLCIAVQYYVPELDRRNQQTVEPTSRRASCKLSWSTDESTIQIATVYFPATREYAAITIDLAQSYGKTTGKRGVGIGPGVDRQIDNLLFNKREPYAVNLGPSRLSRRLMERGSADKGDATTEQIQILIESLDDDSIKIDDAIIKAESYLTLSESFIFIDAFSGIQSLQARRNQLGELAKLLAVKLLAGTGPTWANQIGSKGLRKLMDEASVSDEVKRLLRRWSTVDTLFGEKYRFLWSRVTARRDSEFMRVAHAIVDKLKGTVDTIAIEEPFVKSVAEKTDKYDDYGIRKSQRHRQWAAPSRFKEILLQVALKNGIKEEKVPTARVTVTCSACGTENDVGSERFFNCGNPGCIYHEEEFDRHNNAAFNLLTEAEAVAAATD